VQIAAKRSRDLKGLTNHSSGNDSVVGSLVLSKAGLTGHQGALHHQHLQQLASLVQLYCSSGPCASDAHTRTKKQHRAVSSTTATSTPTNGPNAGTVPNEKCLEEKLRAKDGEGDLIPLEASCEASK
jgi:hypothetical protein